MINNSYFTKKEIKNTFELYATKKGIIIRITMIIFAFLIFYIVLLAYCFFGTCTYVIIFIFLALLFYHIYYIGSHVHIFIGINTITKKMYFQNLWNVLSGKTIEINIDEIQNILIDGDHNHGQRMQLWDLLDYINFVHSKIIVQTNYNHNYLIYSSSNEEDINFISWKIAQWLGCEVFAELYY